MNTQISNLIKKLRLNKKFSQGQVAKAVGVSRPTYMAIESGKNKFDIEVAEKLAGLFGIVVITHIMLSTLGFRNGKPLALAENSVLTTNLNGLQVLKGFLDGLRGTCQFATKIATLILAKDVIARIVLEQNCRTTVPTQIVSSTIAAN
jgi:DNA-binding XRE family transcriptional regulator